MLYVYGELGFGVHRANAVFQQMLCFGVIEDLILIFLKPLLSPQVLDSTFGEVMMLITFGGIRESLSHQSNQEAPLIVTVGSR